MTDKSYITQPYNEYRTIFVVHGGSVIDGPTGVLCADGGLKLQQERSAERDMR